MHRIFVLTVLVCYTSILFSQTSVVASLNKYQAGKGTIKINQNQSIEELLDKHIQICKKANTVQGYRIRIFYRQGKNHVNVQMMQEVSF